jgi:hypothetical protein
MLRDMRVVSWTAEFAGKHELRGDKCARAGAAHDVEAKQPRNYDTRADRSTLEELLHTISGALEIVVLLRFRGVLVKSFHNSVHVDTTKIPRALGVQTQSLLTKNIGPWWRTAEPDLLRILGPESRQHSH